MHSRALLTPPVACLSGYCKAGGGACFALVQSHMMAAGGALVSFMPACHWPFPIGRHAETCIAVGLHVLSRLEGVSTPIFIEGRWCFYIDMLDLAVALKGTNTKIYGEISCSYMYIHIFLVLAVYVHLWILWILSHQNKYCNETLKVTCKNATVYFFTVESF